MTMIEQKQHLIQNRLDYPEQEWRYSGKNESSRSDRDHSAQILQTESRNPGCSTSTCPSHYSVPPPNEQGTDESVNPTCQLLARSAIARIIAPRDILKLSMKELCKIRPFSSLTINFAVNLYRLKHLPIERINISCNRKCKCRSKSSKTQIDPNLLSTNLNYTKLEFNAV